MWLQCNSWADQDTRRDILGIHNVGQMRLSEQQCTWTPRMNLALPRASMLYNPSHQPGQSGDDVVDVEVNRVILASLHILRHALVFVRVWLRCSIEAWMQ